MKSIRSRCNLWTLAVAGLCLLAILFAAIPVSGTSSPRDRNRRSISRSRSYESQDSQRKNFGTSVSTTVKDFSSLQSRQTGSTPADCRVETLTQSISLFSFDLNSATWEGWLSMLCNRPNFTVWDNVEILATRSDFGPLISGKTSGIVRPPPGLAPTFIFYSTCRVRVPIVDEQDVRYFPFDRIYVPIQLESLVPNTTMRLAFPRENARLAHDFFTDDAVAVNDAKTVIIDETIEYGFSFLGGEEVSFDRVTVVYEFDRDDSTNWVQAMLPTFLSFALSMWATFLPVAHSFDARMGILGASIFVVVLNIGAINALLAFPTVMTVGDYVNMVSLVLIALVFLESIVERWLFIRNEQKQAALEEMEEEVEETEDRKAEAQEIAEAIASKQIILGTLPPTDQGGDVTIPRHVIEKTTTAGTSYAAATAEVDLENGLQKRPTTTKTPTRAPTAKSPTGSKRPPSITSQTDKTRCCVLFPQAKVKTDDGGVKVLTRYEQFLVNMSLMTFVLGTVAYIAIVVGLLVGYRPPKCYEDVVC